MHMTGVHTHIFSQLAQYFMGITAAMTLLQKQLVEEMMKRGKEIKTFIELEKMELYENL